MTLNTSVYIHDDIDAMRVFKKARDLIGSTEKTRARFYFHEDGTWSIGNEVNQGLSALLDLAIRPGEPLRSLERAAEHSAYCDDDCDGKDHEHPCWLELTFDTAYSYKDGQETCGHLHARLVAELGHWLDDCGVRWEWENEFTGEIHSGYDRLADLAGGGDQARQWFTDTVLPAIRQHVAGSSP